MSAANPPNNHLRGVTLVLIAAALWSTSGLLVRIIDADEPTIIFWRSVSASVSLGLYILFVAKESMGTALRSLGWPGLVVAVLFAIDAILSIFALAHTHVANVMLVFSMTPFITAVIAWFWLRERVLPKTWLSMTLCVGGVAIMVSGSLGTTLLFGDSMAFIAGCLFSISVVAIRRYPNFNLLVAIWLSSMFSIALSLPFATPFGHGITDYTLMGVFGAVEYALALLLFTIGARYIPAAQATLIGLLEVVLSPIWVWLAINEIPSKPTLIGGSVILVTLMIYTLHDVRTSRRTQPVVG